MFVKRWMILLGAVGVLLGSALQLQAQSPTAETLITIDVAGQPRSYALYQPPALADQTDYPLLIALHATASSGRALEALAQLDRAADERGFMVAYPNSLNLTWNEQGSDPSLPDDVAFISTMLDSLLAEYPINAEQIWVTGLGNGGLMSYRLACHLGDRLAGVAVVGPLPISYHRDDCPSAKTPNILMIHGTADPFYAVESRPYNQVFSGGDPNLTLLGVQDSLDFWAGRLGCTDQIEANSTITFGACADEGRLYYYRVEGGASQWLRPDDGLNQTGLSTTWLVVGFLTGQTDWNRPQTSIPTGEPRTFTFYIPSSYDPATPMPLVMLLHGRSGTGASMAFTTQMNLWAEREGFIALYPDGLERQWNYVDGLAAYPEQGYNDADFLGQLLDDLSTSVSIDSERVYVGGLSNGGFMAQYLACTDRDRYAAFASVGATAFGGIWDLCPQSLPNPAPIIFIHGSADSVVPWEGYQQGQAWLTLSVNDTIGFWAALNGCGDGFDSEELPAQSETPTTRTGIMRLNACPTGGEIELYGVIGGGHNWPGNVEGVPVEIGGTVSTDFYASEVIWQFFAAH